MTAASVLAAVAIPALAVPAFAATGSFPWNVTMTHQVDSRNWTQTSGSTVINSKLACWNPSISTYRIELFKNRTFGDDSKGAVNFKCGSTTQQYTWTNLTSGNYHFTISKATDGIQVSGSGTVVYPSN
ncbi:hypothetical protein [Nocardioides sp. InS609-2]|uniref:hypothetical protein n=1 Tax=Nocardioides sp. InS609-2 TaxID=2760705 RepID=UPI0020BDB987|nr:hypothetical protein [Nocardioides sp. InS609-2]